MFVMAKNPTQTLQAMILDKIGRDKVCAALGVGHTAVSNAAVRGEFPASWFVVLSSLAEEAGIDCPPELFKMRRVSRAAS